MSAQNRLFHVSREFICAATEFYFTPNTSTYARLNARYLMLLLCDLPTQASNYASDAMTLARGIREDQDHPAYHSLENLLIAFAAYINPSLQGDA